MPFVMVLALAVQTLAPAPATAAVPAWTTYRHDAARSGIDPDSTSPVTPSQVWQTPALDGEVYAQPLVYGPYVYLATENDTVYKLVAATGAVVWSKHLATPEPSSEAPCGDIAPTIGITGTPVIDPVTNRIYAVGAVSVSGVVRHELFGLDLGSGQPIAGFPIVVDPPFPAGGTPVNQLQRSGLALDGGRILIAFGGNDGDCSTYWGWVVSAPTNGSTALGAFQVDRDYHDGALWGGGNAPAINSAGDAFVATGNGNGDTTTDPEYGDSVVELNSLATPLDSWSPPDWQALDSGDLDLGSSMPTLLPGGYVFQSGKDGNGYLLNGAALGGVASPVAEASGFCAGGVSDGGSVYDSADSTVYAACSAGLKALSLGTGSPPSLAAEPGFSAPSAATGPPMIAGGLVWATNYSSDTLYGLAPSSGAITSRFTIPEQGSQVNHFASPSAGGGDLFLASGDQVTAYKIALPPPPSATRTTLVSSANPAKTGTTISLTAAIAPAPDAGTVGFTDGGAPISGCARIDISPATAGRAICRTAFTRAGRNTVVATYSGDAYYATSASTPVSESITSANSGPGKRGASSRRVPRISHVSISPRRVRVHHDATLRLTLSEAATIHVAITQVRHGHQSRRRCSVKAHRGKRCRLRVTLLRRRFHARARRRAFRLPLHRLAAGHYTALIYATNREGRRSRTIRVTFTITQP